MLIDILTVGPLQEGGGIPGQNGFLDLVPPGVNRHGVAMQLERALIKVDIALIDADAFFFLEGCPVGIDGDRLIPVGGKPVGERRQEEQQQGGQAHASFSRRHRFCPARASAGPGGFP